MSNSKYPDEISPPEDIGGQLDSRNVSPDTAHAVETLSAISADLAELLRSQKSEEASLEELSKKLEYVREVLDYSLNVTPEAAKNEEDLYPIVTWMGDRFDSLLVDVTKLYDLLADASLQRIGADPLQASSQRDALLSEAEESLKRDLENISIRLSQIEHQLLDFRAQYSQNSAQAAEPTEAGAKGGTMQPYDDIDIQFEELRRFITERTSRWRLYENFFYGLVILLLLVNLVAIFWAGL
jgi:DNA repair exonuclease SbcCD ATPase subunit